MKDIKITVTEGWYSFKDGKIRALQIYDRLGRALPFTEDQALEFFIDSDAFSVEFQSGFLAGWREALRLEGMLNGH